VRREVLKAVPKGEQPTYDNVRDIKYMDMVINETLRKYPLAST
jgi:hypothetical protein